VTRKPNLVGILGKIATFIAGLAMPDNNLYTPASIRVVFDATRRVGCAAAGYWPAIITAGLSIDEPVARTFGFCSGVTEPARRFRW